MRLLDFLIHEKVSKKELKDIFNNDNILVGAEFEYIDNDMQEIASGGRDKQQLYNDAMSDYGQWEREMEEWRDEYHKIEKDKEDTHEELTELENNKESLEEKINDKKSEYENEDDEEDKETIQYEIDELSDELSDLEDEIDKKQDLIRDYESDLELHDQDMPRPGSDYIMYMGEIQGENINFLDPTELPEPDEPDSFSLDESDWVEYARETLPRKIEDAEFVTDYEIAGYGDVDQDVGEDLWGFEYDSSISDEGGVEMKTPPLPLSKFIDILPDILDWISDNGTTTDKCGLHFHMSLKDEKNINRKLDLIKMVLFTEEELIWELFPSRMNNHYTEEVKNKFMKNAKSENISDYLKDLMGNRRIDTEQVSDMLSSHYDAIHKVRDSSSTTHVEFRHPGGNNYHKKLNEIKKILGRYGYVLSVGVDPNYKFKDYVKKVFRVFNKIEYVEKEVVLNRYKKVQKSNFYSKDIEYMLGRNGDLKEKDKIVSAIKSRMRQLRSELKEMNIDISNKEERAIWSKMNKDVLYKQEWLKIQKML